MFHKLLGSYLVNFLEIKLCVHECSNRVRRSSPLLVRCPAGRPSPSAVTRSGLRVPSHRVPSTTAPCGVGTTALAGGQTPARRRETTASCGVGTTALAGGQTPTRRPSKPRTAYKHIPHRDKPPHLVARRNARERRRVQAVNSAFLRLRRHLPHPVVGKHKRLSKVWAHIYGHVIMEVYSAYTMGCRQW